MLKLWLQELKNNTTAKKALCLTDAFIDEFLHELDLLAIPSQTFVVANPVNPPEKPKSVAISYYMDYHVIDRPTSIRKVGNEWWVSSYNTTISRFDENFSFLGKIGRYGNPNTTDYYSGAYGFCVDTTNDRIVIACYGYHRVLCYQLSTMQLLWKAGTGTTGDVSQGRLQNPIHVEFLPNGNVLVSCYNGRGMTSDGTTGLYYGHLTELDINTGNIIASRLLRLNDAMPWNNDVYRPTRFTIDYDESKIYVCTNSNYVGVWDVNTWEYITVYTKPRNIAAGGLGLWGVYVDKENNEIVGGLGSVRKIAALDLTTHDLKWQCGVAQWDDRSDALNNPGTLISIQDVLKYDENYYFVVDYSNNRIMYIPKSDYVYVQYSYELPEGYEVIKDLLPDNFDLETNTMRFDLDNYNPKPIVIPIRKCG